MKKNAIIYLVRSSNHDLRLLETSIGFLKNNFIGLDVVDIIIFHEQSLRPALDFVKSLHKNIICREIEFCLPDFYNQFEISPNFPHPFNPSISFGIGYRHMCRFFSGEIFKQEILDNYENYLRLDTDSFILKMDFNLFEFVEKNNIYYGYIDQGVQFDEPGVTKGLWELVRSFEPNLSTPENKMFYTNFEICNISWFRGDDYMNFYKKIDESGGIMTGRWGDAPIRYLGVDLYMSSNNKYGFTDIVYQHGSFITHLNQIV